VFPAYLTRPIDIGFRQYPAYRLFLIASGAVIALLLWLALDNSLYGARLRAAVDNLRVARAVGINVSLLFTSTFIVGCGLAVMPRQSFRRHHAMPKQPLFIVGFGDNDVSIREHQLHWAGWRASTEELPMKILLKAALILAASAMPYVHVQAEPAMRQVPTRELQVPDTVSPEDQALIGAPLSPIWNVHPTSADEWKELVAKVAARAIAGCPSSSPSST
jgi:hypothetical protein